MPLVALLRAVNVGGHKTFRPSELARQWKDLDVTSIGAAGTFVVHQSLTPARLRSELARRLPFDAEMMVCQGRDVLRLVERDPFEERLPSGAVRFVSVLSRSPRTPPQLPVRFPERGPWLLKLLGRDGRFVFGAYRRDPKAVRYLREVERLFGLPATTRNWNTLRAVARALQQGSA